jgi:hypothetical protein
LEQLVDLTLLRARRNARVPPGMGINELTPVALLALLDTPGRSVYPHRHDSGFNGLPEQILSGPKIKYGEGYQNRKGPQSRWTNCDRG